MQEVVILDTRNQKDAFVEKALLAQGCTVLRSKLPFGDVALTTDLLNCVDLKSSGGGLIELARNVCSGDHARVKREITRCLSYGGRITFLCFEPNMHCIEDIASWQVPTFRHNVYKDGKLYRQKGQPLTRLKPETLMKAIATMTTPNHYADGFTVGFDFTTKADCGQKILQILRR